ncbi:hypothetical protein IEQ34_021987 [Dendrobium chrysotoxum]|uniref:Uncharacterized protein n=1 Tax=Dendrobium chrysotoxum TaxID=161865 RepID=A0AAV7FXN6_DENCH|nr:hypothetical protein IEQ34_021987 [Dendrobium chrysotoxum]
MESEEELLFEAANALLLLSSSPPPDLPPAATINLFKPHPLPPAKMPVTSIKNVLTFSLPSWGARSRRSHHMGKLKRKQVEGPSPPTAVAATCGHRSPDTPPDLGAASNPSSIKSDGFMRSSEIRPFKRLRTCEASVPEYDAHLKLKRKQVEGHSPSTVVAATCGHRSPDTPLDLGAAANPSSIKRDGFMCSSEIRPLKRLRTRMTSVPRCDADIQLKRKQVEGPSPSTAVAANCSHRSPHTPLDLGAPSDPSTSRSDGFPYSSEIRGCGFRCNDGLKTGGRDDSRAVLLFMVSGERGRAFAVG